MGSAISSIGQSISNIPGDIASGNLGAAGSDLFNTATLGLGGSSAPHATLPALDQSAILASMPQQTQQLGQVNQAIGNSQAQQGQAFGNVQQGVGTQLGLAQTQLPSATQQNQQAIGNLQNQVTSSLPSAQQQQDAALTTLAGAANGTAPSQAQGVLQQGTDKAIQAQQALANSGNLSQMIGGQKTAMDNAANLIQQQANDAAQLRATEQAANRANYAQATGQNLGTNVSAAGTLAGATGTQLGQQLTNLQNATGNSNNAYGTSTGALTSQLGQGVAGAQGITQAAQTTAGQQLARDVAQAGADTAGNQAITGILGSAIGGAAGGASSALTGNLLKDQTVSPVNQTQALTTQTPVQQPIAFNSGGYVPGEPNKRGDSPFNDKIHAMLSPGEFIIPRSVTEDKKFMGKVEQKVNQTLQSKFLDAVSKKKDSRNKDDNDKDDIKEAFKAKKDKANGK